MAKLTKADILRSTDHTVEVYIDSLEGEVPIKPLSAREWAEIEAQGLKGMQQTATVSRGRGGGKGRKDSTHQQDMELHFDLADMARNEFETKALTVFYGLATEEEWKLDEVRGLPPSVIDELAEEIQKISGADMSEVESFRSLARRQADEDSS